MSTELRVENYSLEKNNMLTNHDSNRNRNMSRTDEVKESETNEDKQKNEVRDAFTTLRGALFYCRQRLMEAVRQKS